jgi:hypothetical protein
MSEEGTGPVSRENEDEHPEVVERRVQNVVKLCANRAAVLLLFRDGQAQDMVTLSEAIGLRSQFDRAWYPSYWYMAREHLGNSVEKLIEAGLLQADKPIPIDSWSKDNKITATELVRKVQTALDLSLKSLASFDRDKSMTVEPLFGIPDPIVEKLDVFVLMPFKADMLPVYEDHIKPTCTSMGLTVRRGDDFFTANSVVQDIWKGIVSARLIVADCTDRNPNVFYEIGLAHTIGKPTILLTRREEDIPFDLRYLRYIPYEHTPRGMKGFETTFKETLRNVLPRV